MEKLIDIITEYRDTGVGKEVSEELLNLYSVKQCEEMMIPTRDGETHVYIYEPFTDNEIRPALINIHGGGFVKGYRQQDIVFAKNICSRAGCVVVDIDYTPAPEQKYPYAIHQCYDVTKWVFENCHTLKIDPSKIAISGHSAGGTYATAVAILANQSKEFQLCLQILDYPCLDVYTPQELKRNAYAYSRLPPERGRIYNMAYIDEHRKLEPTASPLFAPDFMLEGLPETLIITCGDDALGEEGEKYAYRLLEVGVPITARRFLNSHHGFVVRRLDDFEEAEIMILQALGRKF